MRRAVVAVRPQGNTMARGTQVGFEVTFFDDDDVAFNPTSATLYINYSDSPTSDYGNDPSGGADATIVLTQTGDIWSGSWLSSVAEEGNVHWSIRTAGVGSIIAKDGKFQILANNANPSP